MGLRVVERFCQKQGGQPVLPVMNATTPKKVVYSGIFLDDASHRELLAWFSKETGLDLLDKTFAHHTTLKFKPSAEEVSALPLGKKVQLRVVGWGADAKGQAVVVDLQDAEVQSANAHPHITVAVGPGGSPAYSNELLASGVTRVAGPTLEGVVDTFPRE